MARVSFQDREVALCCVRYVFVELRIEDWNVGEDVY